ncbi:ALP1-like protein isoform X1 [Tanacetum coccineum]
MVASDDLRGALSVIYLIFTHSRLASDDLCDALSVYNYDITLNKSSTLTRVEAHYHNVSYWVVSVECIRIDLLDLTSPDRVIAITGKRTYTHVEHRNVALETSSRVTCPGPLFRCDPNWGCYIWHAYFGVPGANNDLNVLYGSPLFDDEIADIAPECPFVVNGHTYRKCYYLADGIYPAWSTFVKTFSVARDEKTLKFKRVQEAARKDIERAFGVLQGRWGIIRQPARAMQINILKRIMYCCIILHNMILEDEGFEVNLRDVFVNPAPNIVRDWVERCDLHVRKTKELRDRKTHIDLRQDLMEHLWNNDDE